jgi:hypothetical protein
MTPAAVTGQLHGGRQAMDQLYPYKAAGKLLGIGPDSVRQLVHDGKLESVTQVVRGRGERPRRFVTASSLESYIRQRREAAAGAAREASARRRPHRSASGVRAEVEAATRYV